jgi:hypothetical protein
VLVINQQSEATMRITITLSDGDWTAIRQQAASMRMPAARYIVVTMMQHIASNSLAANSVPWPEPPAEAVAMWAEVEEKAEDKREEQQREVLMQETYARLKRRIDHSKVQSGGAEYILGLVAQCDRETPGFADWYDKNIIIKPKP